MNKFVNQPIDKRMNKQNVITRLEKVENKAGLKPSVTVGNLSEISPDAGDQIAGTYYVVDQETGAIRGYMTATPNEQFPGYYLAFFDNAGTFQFGVNADTGKGAFAAGAVTIGADGIIAALLNDVLTQTADDGTTYRRGRLGMFALPGHTAPSFGLRYADASEGSELVVNGDFGTGDFTGWTDDGGGGTWSVVDGMAVCDGYGTKHQVVSVTAGVTYVFSARGVANDSPVGRTVRVYGTGVSQTIQLSTVLASYSQTFMVPTGTTSVTVQISSIDSGASFDDISLKSISSANYVGFDPEVGDLVSTLPGTGVPGRVPVVDMTIWKPSRSPSGSGTVAGNLTGTFYYRTTFVDNYGETDAPVYGLGVAVTNKKIDLTYIVTGGWGTTARRIYRASLVDPTYRLLTTINDNTTTTYQDNTVDISSNAELPIVNTTGSRPMLPRSAVIWAYQMITNNANWVATSLASHLDGWVYYAAAASANDGDWFDGSFMLEAGTYTLHTFGAENTNQGRLDYYIDNVLVISGQDWYNGGGSAVNVEKTASVTVATSGYHHLHVVVNGKNGSSSDYVVRLTRIWFTPAAY